VKYAASPAGRVSTIVFMGFLRSDRCRIALKMLLQVAAKDIGQLTDKERK
jgi:hypothetical protein